MKSSILVGLLLLTATHSGVADETSNALAIASPGLASTTKAAESQNRTHQGKNYRFETNGSLVNAGLSLILERQLALEVGRELPLRATFVSAD